MHAKGALSAAVLLLLVSAQGLGIGRVGQQDARLPDGHGRVVGRVLMTGGGRDVTVVARPQAIGPAYEMRATLPAGTFAFTLPSGTYTLQLADAPDLARRRDVHVQAGQDTFVDLASRVGVICECVDAPARPARSVAIAGLVADGRGHPIPLAEVTLLGGGTKDEFVAQRDGAFHAVVPADRDYQLSVSYPGFASVVHVITVGRSSPGHVRVTLPLGDTERAPPPTRRWDFGCRCGAGLFTHTPSDARR